MADQQLSDRSPGAVARVESQAVVLDDGTVSLAVARLTVPVDQLDAIRASNLVDRRERHPATNAPGATRRRVHETAAWIARWAFRASSDGALHVHGITRPIYRYPPLLRPAHLSPYGRAVLRRALRLTGHVMCRDGRIVHHSLVRPPRLAVDGHAYRNRTRRRTRKSSR